VGKSFRNEGVDSTHNPEFTSIELYEAYADYNDMMALTEELLRVVCQEVLGKTCLKVASKDGEPIEIDFGKPFKRLGYICSLEDATGQIFPPPESMDSPDSIKFLKDVAQMNGVESKGAESAAKLLDRLCGELVEPHCVQPTFLVDHPACMSPLAKGHRSRAGLTERFELFVLKRELANAYTELNDPREQRNRFEQQLKARSQGDDEAVAVDDSFVDALEYGLPPTGGWGLGVDRLIMTILSQHSIREVILFPVVHRPSR